MNSNQDQITQIITGFDSAWTDNPKQPGAIASIIQYRNGQREWMAPQLATFSQAQDIICNLSDQSPYHFVAI